MGPLAQLYMMMLKQREEEAQRPHGGMLEQESVFAPRQGLPPRNFRDPEQAGPAPPAGPLAKLYGGR